MGLNPSGYYKWKNRLGTKNRYEQTRSDIYDLIKEYHQEKPSKGYRALRAMILYRTGWMVSNYLVHKCCQDLGIKSRTKHYHYNNSGEEHIRYPNRVRGQWNATKPLELVVSDMTCINSKGKHYEWTYLLDTFNNEIIASHVSDRQGDIRPYYACLNDLKQMIKEQTTPTVLHTDQGAVYSSRAFEEAHKDYNIIRSMSRVGTPTDNAVIEGMNGWIKEELSLDYNISRCENVPQLLDEYVSYYNHERPAFALDYKTPVQYRTERGF